LVLLMDVKWSKLLFKLGITLVVIGLTIFDYAEVAGMNWKLFHQNDSGMYFYDAKDMTRSSKNIVEVWTRLKYTVRI
jgi:hypothetical protein